MAITVFSKITPILYTPKSEEKAENPTKFQLKPLDGLQYMDVLTHTSTDQNDNVTLSHLGMRLALKHGLLNAVGLLDELGNDIELSAQMLDVTLLIELSGKIMEISNLTESERKNLS